LGKSKEHEKSAAGRMEDNTSNKKNRKKRKKAYIESFIWNKDRREGPRKH